MVIARGFMLGFILLVLTTLSFSQTDEISRRLGLGNASGLSDSKIASGLKEAQRVGADNSVRPLASATDTSATQP